MTHLPELGVISTHPEDDWLCHNDDGDQLESACSASHPLRFRSSSETNERGIHVHIHSDESDPGDRSEEEVTLCTD